MHDILTRLYEGGVQIASLAGDLKAGTEYVANVDGVMYSTFTDTEYNGRQYFEVYCEADTTQQPRIHEYNAVRVAIYMLTISAVWDEVDV